MDEQAVRDYEEAVADGTADAVWTEDEEATVTARADEWSAVWSELEWIAIGDQYDHRDEAEKLPEDQADAKRLLDLLIDRTPDGVEDLDSDEAYGVRLGQRDVDRIVELTGVHVGS